MNSFRNRIERPAEYTARDIPGKNFLVIRITRRVNVKIIHGEKYIRIHMSAISTVHNAFGPRARYSYVTLMRT